MIHQKIVVTPEQMKFLEAETDKHGTSYEQMMEYAGMALYLRTLYGEKSKKLFSRKPRIIFLCGNGNNAGDCFFAAQMVHEQYKDEIDAMVFLLCGRPKTPLAKLNFGRMNGVTVIEDEEEMLEILSTSLADIKVDGVFGTGFHGELPENVKRIFSACKSFIIAADVPSGGNCKTGAVAEGTMKAIRTITFGAKKFGMTQYPLKE